MYIYIHIYIYIYHVLCIFRVLIVQCYYFNSCLVPSLLSLSLIFFSIRLLQFNRYVNNFFSR